MHDQTMLTIRTYLKNKEYLAAVSLIEKIEQQGIYQSDNLGYIKARMLYKLGHNVQARTALRLYIAEHEESGSKYVIKAKQPLELL